MEDLSKDTKRQVTIWLGVTLAMVLCMVFIGGGTRLTDSGLSMVQWRPLLGAIPPMNEQEWLEVFKQYQQFPEYKIVNNRMNLEEFKFIFFWEYFHRLFGRLIGLVFILPYLYFLVRKQLNKGWNRKLLLALVLGGSQGLLGWFMVKSGLVDRPDVSHYRLAAHFGLALIIMAYIYWLMLELKQKTHDLSQKTATHARKVIAIFSVIVVLQVVYGAFVAGLDAGIGYNTFPKMGRYWIPTGLYSYDSFWQFAFESNVGVQFIHRCVGWSLFGFAFYFLVLASQRINNKTIRRNFYLLSTMIFVQFALGVFTILSMVKLSLASAHQMGACVLVLLTVKTIYDLIHINTIEHVELKSADKTTA